MKSMRAVLVLAGLGPRRHARDESGEAVAQAARRRRSARR